MKWKCPECNFQWEGTVNTFDKVRVHEKTHKKKIQVTQMPGFLGDKQTNVVHHLANMKKDCKIVDVKINDKQYFDPDTLENAKSKNFSPCLLCITN